MKQLGLSPSKFLQFGEIINEGFERISHPFKSSQTFPYPLKDIKYGEMTPLPCPLFSSTLLSLQIPTNYFPSTSLIKLYS